MLKVFLIRHGKTQGNIEKRYIGTTDEPLLPESVEMLKSKSYPKVDHVYSSPLKRAIETARAIYPKLEPIIVEGLKECDFGDFENKNYIELADSNDYSSWVSSNGTLPFPKGESHEGFKNRCTKAFLDIINDNKSIDKYTENAVENVVGIIAHGGTIMSILEQLSTEKRSFYDWSTENGEGYECSINEDNTINIVKKV